MHTPRGGVPCCHKLLTQFLTKKVYYTTHIDGVVGLNAIVKATGGVLVLVSVF